MKRLIVFILQICFSLTLFGCSFNVEYEFMNPTDEITAIEIVRLYEPEIENTGFREEVIGSVEDIDLFVEKFNEIHCEKIFGSPSSMFPNTVALRVTYLNGDYELINYDAQYSVFADRDGWQYGFYILDKEPFKELIKQYYPPEELPPSKSSDLVDESNNP